MAGKDKPNTIRSLSLALALTFRPILFLYLQLSGWVDAVLFVFSVEDESSFNEVSTFYHRMIHLRSSNNDNIPLFLVGTQGGYFLFLFNFTYTKMLPFAEAISEATPRVVSESRARKLCNEMKRCTYYETCAANGLSVDDVFDDGKSAHDLYWHTNQLMSHVIVSVSGNLCICIISLSVLPHTDSLTHCRILIYFIDSLQANCHDAQLGEHAQSREWPEFSSWHAKPHWRLPKHVKQC